MYHNYLWDAAIGRDEVFRRLNIIYGRNYSGKTTLSRIFKCIEDNCLHGDYADCNFSITTDNGTVVTHTNLPAFGAANKIRVYNSDFVRENLSWLHNIDGSIKPFTVLGAINVEIEKKIKEIDDQLGSIETKAGIIWDLAEKTRIAMQSITAHDELSYDIENRLRNKAREIKDNANLYDYPTYNITWIKKDIPVATEKAILTEEQITEKKKLLREESKGTIARLPETKPNFASYLTQTEALLQKQIKPSQPITELINDNLLQEWVRLGIDKHKGKRTTCGFCGNALPADLWNKLDAHFSKESEEMRNQIKIKIQELEKAKQSLDAYLSLDKDRFYSSINPKFYALHKKWVVCTKSYSKNIEKLVNLLKERESDIFNTKTITDVQDESDLVAEILKEFNQLIDEHNLKTKTLSVEQNKARESLRISEVAKYLKDINYPKLTADVAKLQVNKIAAEKDKGAKQTEHDGLFIDRRTWEAKAKDESKGAELVNQYLNHFFGHNELRLVAESDSTAAIKFKIVRDNADAKNLSGGESSLISFCYFIAKIADELKAAGDNLIIYIDDPISSLDSNHIFFMFSLIESIIAKPKKYGQLFISTHNLDFLKYLKKLTVPKYKPQPESKDKADINYFLIERKNKNTAQLKLSPDYLKHYITEFNYLFNQIYDCSLATDKEINHSHHYNFGNNMRKFLEAYLFYKYPSHKLSLDQRLNLFFDNDQVTINLINRVVNEYSHLGEHVDRGLEPIDVDAISKVAKAVITKIQTADSAQYGALLESIGVN